MVKVSVIVPIYNGEKHLQECMDSICCQTLEDIEIICVDDGSTDSTHQILEEYQKKDERIHLYRQEHKFSGVARNLGKSHAMGEYMIFWDGDDFYDSQALEKLYVKAKSVNADVCVCGGNRYLESKEKLYPWPSYLDVKKIPEGEVFNRYTNQIHYLDFTNVAPWNKMFKRDYIQKLDLNFEPVRHGNDIYFVECAIGLANRITTLNEKLVTYRQNKDVGLTRSLDESHLTMLQSWVHVADTLKDFDGFQQQALANRALDSIVHTLCNLEKWETFSQAFEMFREVASDQLYIVQQDDSYYTSDWRCECAKHLYDDTPQEFSMFLTHNIYLQRMEAYGDRNYTKQDLSVFKKDNTKLKKENGDLNRRNENLSQKNETLKEKIRTLRARVKKLRERRQKLNEEIKTLEAKNDALRSETEQLKNSWTFKTGKAVTWLPRTIKKLFR